MKKIRNTLLLLVLLLVGGNGVAYAQKGEGESNNFRQA